MKKITFDKVIYWIRYALNVIVLSIGIMLLLTVLLLYKAGTDSDTCIFCGIVGGLCTIIPILLIRRIKNKGYNQEASENLSSKEKVIRWLDYAWRTIFLIIAIFLFLRSTIFFLTDDVPFGFVCMVISLLFLIPYIKIQSKGNLRSVIHTKRLSWRARLRMFDEEMLNDNESAVEDRLHTCLNCGYDYKGWYCPNCGQDRRKDQIDWRQLILGMVGDAINFDGSTIRTLYELIRRPGVALHNYLGGRHERYSNPMKFVLFSGALFTILSIFLTSGSNPPVASTTVFDKFADNIMIYQCIMAFVVDFFPLYWTFKWTKEGRQFKQVDFYIIMLYLIGMDFWARALFCIPMYWLDNSICNAIRWALMFCYQFYALKDFFRLRFWQTVGLYIPRYILYFGFVIITLIPFIVFDAVEGSGQLHMTERVANTITGDFLSSFWNAVTNQ